MNIVLLKKLQSRVDEATKSNKKKTLYFQKLNIEAVAIITLCGVGPCSALVSRFVFTVSQMVREKQYSFLISTVPSSILDPLSSISLYVSYLQHKRLLQQAINAVNPSTTSRVAKAEKQLDQMRNQYNHTHEVSSYLLRPITIESAIITHVNMEKASFMNGKGFQFQIDVVTKFGAPPQHPKEADVRHESTVCRRYSDFELVHKKLCETSYDELVIKDLEQLFPSKKWISFSSVDLGKQRQEALNKYLAYAISRLHKNSHLILFLSPLLQASCSAN